MIEKNSIERLKSIIDIVDVIGGYVELRKSGANYKGLCPFHEEKTPSFVVSPAKQIFHCFGCGAGGDAITFLMKYENLEYIEAIEKLANLYNFKLNYVKSEKRENCFKILQEINSFYKKALTKNQAAQEYLKKRGVFEASIEKFSIGFAPDSKEQVDFFLSRHIPLQEGIKAGVLGIENERVYARIANRITFAICSPSGAIVGFGGRTITNHPAKYLNSPQSRIFNKSQLLFGYHLSKDTILKKKRL
jgi:DNA primase